MLGGEYLILLVFGGVWANGCGQDNGYSGNCSTDKNLFIRVVYSSSVYSHLTQRSLVLLSAQF